MDDEKDSFKIDELQMYFGDDYELTPEITIHQPSIGEIIKFGEENYFSAVSALTVIPSEMKSKLWDMGIDYSKITDFDLFVLMTNSLTPKSTSILLGDLDLSSLSLAINPQNQQQVLINKEGKIIIDRVIHHNMASYINAMNGLKHKIELPSTNKVKEILIMLDREESAKRSKVYHSQLRPMISAMMRYPAFKYKKNELRECGIYEFMDSFRGAQIYISSTTLLQGSYSGMIDTSKIDNKLFDWTRSE